MNNQEILFNNIKDLARHMQHHLAAPVQNSFTYLIRDGMTQAQIKEIEQDFYQQAQDIQKEFDIILQQAQALFGKVLYHYDDIKEYRMEEI